MGQTLTTRPTTLRHQTCFEIAAPMGPWGFPQKRGASAVIFWLAFSI